MSTEPGDRPPADRAAGQPMGRRLAEPPSSRYARGEGSAAGAAAPGSALRGPLLRAVGAAMAGAAVIFVVGAVFAIPAGLVIAAGATGAAIGLALARAAVPGSGATPVDRGRLTWIAIGLALASVVLADVVTWQYALAEGGALGLVDYLWETFGLLVPGEAVVAAITAAWGATAGPVR